MKRILICLMSLSLFLMVSPASASFTAINPPHTGELGTTDILHGLYGGTWTVAGTRDYTNGIAMATRIEDVRSPLGSLGVGDAIAGSNSDQIWHDGFVSASAWAVYSSASQRFGYKLGTSGGTFHPLMDISGSGFSTSGDAELNNLSGLTWRWARQSLAGTGTVTSANADNPSGLDRMITYHVTGLKGPVKSLWLLLWEDGTDRDFNDLAVEVNLGPSRRCAVPVPAAVWGGLGVLGALALTAIRRKAWTV